ncbi:MAG: hypothetical protein JW844_06555 [Candidatus Omnitrophica bacterium]|nr:hypothetical protein [Candidatus Omnitrophota bacterium]
MNSKKGIALIIVLSVLAVASIIAISFLFTMRLEEHAASNFLNTIKARYIAEMGVVHARRLLEEDSFLDRDRWVSASETIGLGYDGYNESWHELFTGSDVDVDGDGTPESRWIPVEGGTFSGRYAVLVSDEAGKLNLNMPRSDIVRDGIASIFTACSSGGAQMSQATDALFAYRYGPDKKPGVARRDDDFDNVLLTNDGIDNDGDGHIDEAGEGIDEDNEFLPAHPRGDDAAFSVLERYKTAARISDDLWARVRPFLTVYSQSDNLDMWGLPRININNVSAEELVEILKSTGFDNPWQIAVNIADFIDDDFVKSSVVKATRGCSVKACFTYDLGSWEFVGGHYRCLRPGGLPGVWQWQGVPPGDYYVKVYGYGENSKVGDVTINGVVHPDMEHDDLFGLFAREKVTVAEDTILQVEVQNNFGAETTTYFSGVELIPVRGGGTIRPRLVYGIEGVRINEIMVKPVLNKSTEHMQPGGYWTASGGGFVNNTAGSGAKGEGTWEWTGIPDGKYYLYVYGQSGQAVGDVRVEGVTQGHMTDGGRFSAKSAVSVYGGRLRISIQNNEPEGVSCYFSRIELSQQPDGEYIELVNLTEREVDIGGWIVEGTGYSGWPARIPLGTAIEPNGFIVLAMDADDKTTGLSGNGISFDTIWGARDKNVVGLDFTRAVTPDDDLLRDVPLSGYNMITLRDSSENLVDAAEYSNTTPYIASEKGDPSYNGDTDGDGADEIWYNSLSLSKGTPGEENNNTGMKERLWKDDQWMTIIHSSDEILFRNYPLFDLGTLLSVRRSDEFWRALALEEVMKCIDAFTTEGIRLESECAKPSDNEGRGNGWVAVDRPEPATAWFESGALDDVGYWRWTGEDGVTNGVYSLSIFGRQGESVSISVRRTGGGWSPWTPALTYGVGNKIYFGRVEIGTGSEGASPDSTLEVRLKNTSPKGVAHFDYLRLDPSSEKSGAININTASQAVLEALPGIDSGYAARIMQNRPYGNKENKRRGIGDLLVGDVLRPLEYEDEADKERQMLGLFGAFSNYVTVRSDTYGITVIGQIVKRDKIQAEKRIETIIER